MSDAVFSLDNVCKTYSTGSNGFSVKISNLEIPRGVVTVILGRSGSGKTTLLNLLGGLEQPDGPSAHPSSSLLFHSAGGVDTQLVGRKVGGRFARIGYVFQDGYLQRHSTVALNLAAAMVGAKQPVAYEKLSWGCLQVGLDPAMLDKRAWMPSGGERQRIGIARAMLADPEVILADEPASSLDPQTGLDLMKRLKAWCHAGNGKRSVIWVTHNLGHAVEVADELVVLEAGRLVAGAWPRSMSGVDRDQLENEVYGSGGLPGVDEAVASSSLSDEAADVKGAELGFGRRVGLAELLRAPHSPVWSLRWLSRLISYPHPGAGGNSRWHELFQVIKSYRQLTFLAVMSLAGFFSASTWVGTELIDQVIEAAKLDSRACQIIVDGQRTGGPGLSRESLNTLKMRPWLASPDGRADDTHSGPPSDEVSKGEGCGGVVAAYERILLPRETISAVPGSQCSIGTISVNTLVLDPEDPVLAQIPVKRGTVGGSNSAETTLAEAFTVDRPGRRIVLSGRLIEKAAAAGKCIPKQVNLGLFGQVYTFDVAGAVTNLPSVGSVVPNVAIALSTYKTLYSERNPGESLDNPGQAVVYFTESEFPALVKFLEGSDLYFDRNNLDSYKKKVETGHAVYWLIKAIKVGSLAIVSVMLCFVFSSFLYRNHRPLSVQRAMGVGLLPMFVQIGVYLAVVWMLSLCFVIPSEIALHWAIHAKILPSLGVAPIVREPILSWGWPLVAVLLIGLMSAGTVLGIWWKKTSYLAVALKEDG